jgi:hypothetical protein
MNLIDKYLSLSKKSMAMEIRHSICDEFSLKAFLNGVHMGASPANIVSGFRATGVRPFYPMIPLTSQFAVEPHDLTLYQTRRMK